MKYKENIMDNRDMFYNSYGYSTNGFPNNQMFQPNMMFPNQNNSMMDLDNRISIMNQIITYICYKIDTLKVSIFIL